MPVAPNTANYKVGGHRVRFAAVDLGNIPDISIEAAVTTLDHFTRRSGARVLDRQVITEKRLVFTVTLDEHSVENYQRYFMATRVGNALGVLGAPLVEGAIIMDYLEESGNIATYSHTRGVVRPASPMAFGDGTDWASFQVEIEALQDLAVTNTMGTWTVT